MVKCIKERSMFLCKSTLLGRKVIEQHFTRTQFST